MATPRVTMFLFAACPHRLGSQVALKSVFTVELAAVQATGESSPPFDDEF